MTVPSKISRLSKKRTMHRLMTFAVVCDFVGVVVMASAVVNYTSQKFDEHSTGAAKIKDEMRAMDDALTDARNKAYIGMVFITMAAVANVKIAIDAAED